MKRRIKALFLAGMLLSVSLFGCGSEVAEKTKETKKSGTETVKLRLWAEENNHEMLAGMIESFKEKYAGEAEFDITIETQADSGLRDTLLDDVHGGADVFSFPDDQLISLVAAGVLTPVENADEIKAANSDESVAAASLNDTLYAYPMTADNGYFMYYDKRYFTEDDVKSFDAMLAVADAAGKKISMELSSGWYMYSFFGGAGMQLGLNDDGVTNYCDWNRTDGGITGKDVAQALLDISAHPSFQDAPDGDFPQGVKDGQIIAGISGVWNAVAVKEAWGDDYGAVKLPTYTVAGQQVQMSSFTGYKMMGVNYYSENREWAAKLAEWLTNEENQTIRFEQRDQGPSNKNAAASDAIMNVPAIQAVIEQSKYGNLQRVGNNFWEPSGEFGKIMGEGNPSGADLQELLDAMVAGITKSTVE